MHTQFWINTHTCAVCCFETAGCSHGERVALPYSKPPSHVWGSLKFYCSLVKNRLIFFPISASAGFHFDIVWSTWLFFFGRSLLFPSHSSLLWVGRYNGGSDRKPQAPYSPPPPHTHTHLASLSFSTSSFPSLPLTHHAVWK